MAIFDGRLIGPNEGELARALGKAMRAANRENGSEQNRMSRDAAFWERFAQDVLRSGPEGRRRSCKGGRAVPEVIAGWWTDPAGRKHVRVIGRTRRQHARLRGEVEREARDARPEADRDDPDRERAAPGRPVEPGRADHQAPRANREQQQPSHE